MNFLLMLVEVAICLALLLSTLGSLASILVEGIAQAFNLRWFTLRNALVELLGSEKSVSMLREHPLLKGVSNTKDTMSYLEPAIFARALTDLAGLRSAAIAAVPPAAKTSLADSLDRKLESATAAEKDPLKPLDPQALNALRALIHPGIKTLEDLERDIESWFNASMDRASGWYKRRARWLMLAASMVLALALHVDSLSIADFLTRNPDKRAQLVELAQTCHDAQTGQQKADATKVATPASGKETPTATTGKDSRCDNAAVLLDFPVGWPNYLASKSPEKRDWYCLLFSDGWALIGMILSAFAISFGGEFWFQILGQLVELRAAGKRISGSDDDQLAGPTSNASGGGSPPSKLP
jgi:hypothetical protein